LLFSLFSKCFCNSWFFSRSSVLFDYAYFPAFIDKLVDLVELILSDLFSFIYAFQKLFDSHFHSKLKFIIPFLEYKRSVSCFFCWFRDWHRNDV